MRISKGTRDRAADLCSMAACSSKASLVHAADACDIEQGSEEFDLAWQAFITSPVLTPFRATYAEAESLIRTGWTP
jgi:hypothetical protein